MVTRDYELGVIFNPEVSEEETRAGLDRLTQIVADNGGQIVRVNHWGRRRLAYPIAHHRDGYYVFIDMVLTPETVAELERTLKVSEIVLRYMSRRRDPKAVQQEREEREARDGVLLDRVDCAHAIGDRERAQPSEASDQQRSGPRDRGEARDEEEPGAGVEVTREVGEIVDEPRQSIARRGARSVAGPERFGEGAGVVAIARGEPRSFRWNRARGARSCERCGVWIRHRGRSGIQ